MGKKFLIIHLDDHDLFKKGIRLCLQNHYYDATILNFSDNQNALICILDCFVKKIKIDLIVTDYNHIGQNGLIFAQEVRKLESIYYTKVPVILLTMRMDDYLTQVTNEGVFDFYFHKSIECVELISLIKSQLTFI